ncbi:MAG: hypothetical protein VYA34_06070 [Myxococcota bacterium]|nr:hypothetical protein [Myxococcota bacterium]
MFVSFKSVIDSISEDKIISFVNRPGGYRMPEHPEDVRECLKHAFHHGLTVEVTYDDQNYLIQDARPGQ